MTVRSDSCWAQGTKDVFSSASYVISLQRSFFGECELFTMGISVYPETTDWFEGGGKLGERGER